MAPCRDDTPPAPRATHRDNRACRFAAHVLKTSTLSEMRTERHGFVAPRKHAARRLATMDDMWSEIDAAVLQRLAVGDAAPAEIGQHLGISEAAVSSILAMLVTEGKVRICRATLT
jgi:hypothetical protein